MGLQISDIVNKRDIDFSELKNKIIVVDAFNVIYQFLSTIRQPDGTPLMDKDKNITSHLSGLFYRNMSLILEGLKLAYVFDGKPPVLKSKTKELRQGLKENAKEKYESAKSKGDFEGMGRYAKQFVSINRQIIEESKELLSAMGIPIIQAPSEGESQAAYIARTNKDVFAVASQDYDSLIFEAPRVIQNLTLAKKRKTISGYLDINPQLIELEQVLNSLEISQDQLICLGILVGTDYNPKGVYGIGQKKALKIVKEYNTPEEIFESEDIKDKIEFNWREVFDVLKNPEVDKNYSLNFNSFDFNKIKEMLSKRGFSDIRINSQFDKYKELREKAKQTTLF